jgi:hypothetical protein
LHFSKYCTLANYEKNTVFLGTLAEYKLKKLGKYYFVVPLILKRITTGKGDSSATWSMP